MRLGVTISKAPFLNGKVTIHDYKELAVKLGELSPEQQRKLIGKTTVEGVVVSLKNFTEPKPEIVKLDGKEVMKFTGSSVLQVEDEVVSLKAFSYWCLESEQLYMLTILGTVDQIGKNKKLVDEILASVGVL